MLRLNRIQARAVVLVGESDIADVVAYAGAIEAALPIVLLEVWKNSGHMIQIERRPISWRASKLRGVSRSARNGYP